MDWIHTLKDIPESPSSDTGSDSDSSDETETVAVVEETTSEEVVETNTSEEVVVTDTSEKKLPLSQDLMSLRDSCNEAAETLASLNIPKISEEAFASWVQRYLTLLRRLKSLEDIGQGPGTDVTLHLEIYDILLRMAPAFERSNPQLGYQLRKRKEDIRLHLPTRT